MVSGSGNSPDNFALPVAEFASSGGYVAKYLRYIDCSFADSDRPVHDSISVANSTAVVWPLRWMYEHLATPLPSGGISKVNVDFAKTAGDSDPSEALGIATIQQHFDSSLFIGLHSRDRQEYFLTQLHTAMLRCAEHFSWESQRLLEAHRQIVERDFKFTFFWKKPLTSPDRHSKVQAYIDASQFPTHIYLVFFDQKMHELRRMLLSVGTDGPGAVEFALGDIRWVDNLTVRVQHQNGRDYWLCTRDGELSFFYPRADHGDPHGQYDLGTMYFEGQWVLQDQPRGIELIQAAAAKGFKHAIKFLARHQSSGGDPGLI